MFYIGQNQKNTKIINICFEDVSGRLLNLRANVNETFFSLFQRYIKRARINKKKLSFLLDGHKIDPSLYIGQLKIPDLAKIIVYELDSVNKVIGGGGIGMNFTNLSKQNTIDCAFNINAPYYRNVGPGINICGECKYEKCVAYKNEVIVPLIGIRVFNLIKERGNLKCPACRALIDPKTVAFYLCEYKIKGKYIDNGQIKPFEIFKKAKNKDAAEYYDPTSNGETIIIELIIEVIKYL